MTVETTIPVILDLLTTSIRSGLPVRMVVQGTSMSPALKRGEAVIIRNFPCEELEVGDLIIVERDGVLITHRIVARRADGWYTKGDGLPELDPVVQSGKILGRVEATERGGISINRQLGWRRRLGALIGRLAWTEGRIYRDIVGDRQQVWLVTKLGRLIGSPFRLTILCLAVLWR